MARPLRLNYAGGVYHVTARGNERKAIVRDDRDRARWVDMLAQMVDRYRVRCHAWVLMTNHYHLLLETPTPNLSPSMGSTRKRSIAGTGGSGQWPRGWARIGVSGSELKSPLMSKSRPDPIRIRVEATLAYEKKE